MLQVRRQTFTNNSVGMVGRIAVVIAACTAVSFFCPFYAVSTTVELDLQSGMSRQSKRLVGLRVRSGCGEQTLLSCTLATTNTTGDRKVPHWVVVSESGLLVPYGLLGQDCMVDYPFGGVLSDILMLETYWMKRSIDDNFRRRQAEEYLGVLRNHGPAEGRKMIVRICHNELAAR